MTRHSSPVGDDVRTGAAIALTVVLFLALVLGIVLLAGGGKWLTAPFRGEVEERERTEGSGTFRISTYEEFHDLCASVKTAESRAAALKTELKNDPGQDRAERIRISLTALESSRAELVNEYNSKASQEHRKAFRNADLPARLDVDDQETECAPPPVH